MAMTRARSWPTPPGRTGWGAIAGFAVYSALLAVRSILHVPWRDETQAWLIALWPERLMDLVIVSGEGHPPLWFWLLYAVSGLGHDPALLKGVSLALGIGSLALIWTARGIGTLEKALISAGFFVSFQYTVVARSYGLGMFLLLLAATRCAGQRPRPLLASVLIGLTALVHIYFALAALPLLALFAHQAGSDRGTRIRMAAICGPLLAIGLWTAIASVPAVRVENQIADIVSEDYRFLQVLKPILDAFAPKFGIWAQLLVLPVLAAALWRPRAEAIAFGVAAVVVTAFQMAIYGRQIHHAGVIAVVFLAVYLSRPDAFSRRPMIVLLAVSAVSGVVQLWRDIGLPYSGAAEAAAIIRRAGLIDAPWVSYPDSPGTSVAAILDRPVYALECACEVRAVKWARRDRLDAASIASRLRDRVARLELPSVHVMVSSSDVDQFLEAIKGDFEVSVVGETGPAQMRAERFRLLRLTRKWGQTS